MSREALAAGLDRTLSKPERIRPWTYDFDPSGLELLRRAIEHVDRRPPARGRRRPDGRSRRPVAASTGVPCFGDAPAPRTSGRSISGASRATGTPSSVPLIGTRGDLVIADTAGIRRLAARMNILREPGAPSIQAGEIGALGLLHEVGHLLIARYEAERRPGAIRAALADLEDRLGPDAVRLLDRFGEEFPGQGTSPRRRPTASRSCC